MTMIEAKPGNLSEQTANHHARPEKTPEILVNAVSFATKNFRNITLEFLVKRKAFATSAILLSYWDGAN